MYGHAAFLLLRCWLHGDRRGVLNDAQGRPVCRECALAEIGEAS